MSPRYFDFDPLGMQRLVEALEDVWNETNPVLIHGFVGREEAEQLLSAQSIPIGSFVIRFRFKEPRSIAITSKVGIGRMSNEKYDLHRHQLAVGQRSIRMFQCGNRVLTLPQFILSNPALDAIYNAENAPIPKQSVFGSRAQTLWRRTRELDEVTGRMTMNSQHFGDKTNNQQSSAMCSFDNLYIVLAEEFAEFSISKRKLQSADLIKPFLALGMAPNYHIFKDAFDRIYDWFIGMLFEDQIGFF